MSDGHSSKKTIAPSVGRSEPYDQPVSAGSVLDTHVSSTSTSEDPMSSDNHTDAHNSQLPRPVTLPPRAKPGRRPATDIPLDKRKAQNRQAQRAFRERKRRREDELQDQLNKQQKQHKAEIARIKKECEDERERYERQLEQYQDLRANFDGGQQKPLAPAQKPHQQQSTLGSPSNPENLSISRHSSVTPLVHTLQLSRASWEENIGPVANIPTNILPPIPAPPSDKPISPSSDEIDDIVKRLPDPKQPGSTESPLPQGLSHDPHQDMEIDFTTFGRPPQPNIVLTPDSLTEESCGFCTARSYCICKDADISPPTIGRIDSSGNPGGPLEPSAAPGGPGSCKACLDDPERRRICLSMASRTQRSVISRPEPAPRSSSTSSMPIAPTAGVNLPPPSWSDGRLSCADAISYGRANDPNFESNWNSEAFLGQLRTSPPRHDRACETCDSRNCSAQDVSIASILAAMSNSSGDSTSKNSTPDAKSEFRPPR